MIKPSKIRYAFVEIQGQGEDINLELLEDGVAIHKWRVYLAKILRSELKMVFRAGYEKGIVKRKQNYIVLRTLGLGNYERV